MLETFLFTLLIIAIGLGFLCIRIWVGKRFVHTHVDGNKALNEKVFIVFSLLMRLSVRTIRMPSVKNR